MTLLQFCCIHANRQDTGQRGFSANPRLPKTPCNSGHWLSPTDNSRRPDISNSECRHKDAQRHNRKIHYWMKKVPNRISLNRMPRRINIERAVLFCPVAPDLVVDVLRSTLFVNSQGHNRSVGRSSNESVGVLTRPIVAIVRNGRERVFAAPLVVVAHRIGWFIIAFRAHVQDITSSSGLCVLSDIPLQAHCKTHCHEAHATLTSGSNVPLLSKPASSLYGRPLCGIVRYRMCLSSLSRPKRLLSLST